MRVAERVASITLLRTVSPRTPPERRRRAHSRGRFAGEVVDQGRPSRRMLAHLHQTLSPSTSRARRPLTIAYADTCRAPWAARVCLTRQSTSRRRGPAYHHHVVPLGASRRPRAGPRRRGRVHLCRPSPDRAPPRPPPDGRTPERTCRVGQIGVPPNRFVQGSTARAHLPGHHPAGRDPDARPGLGDRAAGTAPGSGRGPPGPSRGTGLGGRAPPQCPGRCTRTGTGRRSGHFVPSSPEARTPADDPSGAHAWTSRLGGRDPEQPQRGCQPCKLVRLLRSLSTCAGHARARGDRTAWDIPSSRTASPQVPPRQSCSDTPHHPAPPQPPRPPTDWCGHSISLVRLRPTLPAPALGSRHGSAPASPRRP